MEGHALALWAVEPGVIYQLQLKAETSRTREPRRSGLTVTAPTLRGLGLGHGEQLVQRSSVFRFSYTRPIAQGSIQGSNLRKTRGTLEHLNPHSSAESI